MLRLPTTTLIRYFLLLGIAWGLAACQPEAPSNPTTATSPDGKLTLNFVLGSAGQPGYTLSYEGRPVIDTSFLGFTFKKASPLQAGFKVVNSRVNTFDQTWKPVWGEDAQVRNHYQELAVSLQEVETPQREMKVVFRVFDGGLGFRYEVPKQATLADSVFITEELTEFKLTGDHKAWWSVGDWDSYEHPYKEGLLSQVSELNDTTSDIAQFYIPDRWAMNTPVTLRTADGLHLSFHEADLTDYAGMTLHVDPDEHRLKAALVAWPDGIKVKTQTPFVTPWRTVQVSPDAAGLIESHLIVNLNDPNQIEDVSWIEPMKYAGIWWEMHLGVSTWDFAGSQDMTSFTTDLKPTGKHGATTENAKRYIDFCAANGIRGLLIEGWYTGWENWIGPNRPDAPFDFVTTYPDYDLAEVVRYANEKGVAIISHHETSAVVDIYEQQLDTAFKLLENYGIHAVKTGYVGPIKPKGQMHHGQWMVQHYQKVVEKGAQHQVSIVAHEPIKPTGIRRTWPNFLAREGLRGQEFNAWAADGGNPPDHLPIVAFTRMLAGPIDFTPGIFNLKFDAYKTDNQVNTTLAQQLALYVVIYSPVQMAADLPQHYEGHPAFQFIRDVAVDWQQTRVLNGEVGDYVTIARKEKDGDRWFLGSITDESARSFDLKLDFLDPGVTYRAAIYADAEDAHWDENPTAIAITTRNVTAEDELDVELAAGGGLAVSFVPI